MLSFNLLQSYIELGTTAHRLFYYLPVLLSLSTVTVIPSLPAQRCTSASSQFYTDTLQMLHNTEYCVDARRCIHESVFVEDKLTSDENFKITPLRSL